MDQTYPIQYPLMYEAHQPVPLPHPDYAFLSPGSCRLSFKQQPNEALVTLPGKEKVRKPLDPPPILELFVDGRVDPNRQFLQNPRLFCCATLYKAEIDEPYDMSTQKSLAGTLVSSLHRLKHLNNNEGGFFVFGDISIKVQGTFRLCFTLYEFQEQTDQFHPQNSRVQHLGSAISSKFNVLAAKDFKGLKESTYLSRAFSDQGVRLRLRKEPRSSLHKRAYEPASEPPLLPDMDPPVKRNRQEYAPASQLPYPPQPPDPHVSSSSWWTGYNA